MDFLNVFNQASSSRHLLIATTLIFLSIMVLSFHPQYPAAKLVSTTKKNTRTLPLLFEANKGQTANQVRFLTRNQGYTIFFTTKEIVMDFRRPAQTKMKHGKFMLPLTKANHEVLRLQLVGASDKTHIIGNELLPSQSNYLIGNDPKKWHVNLPHFAKINYQAVYPGTDIIFYGQQNTLEYDIRVAPDANPEQSRFHVDGAKSLKINTSGALVITMMSGEYIKLPQPQLYQIQNGKKTIIDGKFKLFANKNFGFQVGQYDQTKTLIIDPKILYSTYLSGTGVDSDSVAFGIANDHIVPDANIYLTGFTTSLDFPTKNAYQGKNNGKGRTIFVTKMKHDGSELIYSTYLGGRGGNDEGFAINVDLLGNAYITGETNSKDFPVKNAMQPTNRGAKYFSGFVTKLNAYGNDIIYSTYLGGSGDNQEGNAIAVDDLGYAYITGETNSKDFPIKKALQQENKSSDFTAYVTKLNRHGQLDWSTYLGGTGTKDEGNGIVINCHHDVYVVGVTTSKDFPVVNPIQSKPKPKGAAQTGFVTLLHADGQKIIYSTYLGGSGGNDTPLAVSINSPMRSITLVGYTNSTDFPLMYPIQTKNKGNNFSGFISKINAKGNALVYSTYFGGSGGREQITSVKVDELGNAHITGFTNSTDFPVKHAFQKHNLSGKTTAFVARFHHDGKLSYSSYLGGSGGNDRGWGVTVNHFLQTEVAGQTNSRDFPLKNPLQTDNHARTMAFVTKISR